MLKCIWLNNMIIDIIRRYKMINSNELLIIPIIDNKKCYGFLFPITKNYEQLIPNCIELFTTWRIENPTLSPSTFKVTKERTRKWLNESVVDNDNRLLFMITDMGFKCVGHIGLTNFRDENTAEIDSVLKGIKKGYPKYMQLSLFSLMKWAKHNLGIVNFDLEVLQDNNHAINFYKKCSFVEKGIIPLKRVEFNQETRWERANMNEAEKYYLYMEYEEKKQ